MNKLNSRAIIAVVEAETGGSVEIPKGQRTRKGKRWPRYMAMRLCKDELGFSYPQIGRVFNNRHSSVIHGLRRLDAEMAVNPELSRLFDSLAEKCRALIVEVPK